MGTNPGILRTAIDGRPWTPVNTGWSVGTDEVTPRGALAIAIWRLSIGSADHTHLVASARGGLNEARLDLQNLTVATVGGGAVTSNPGGIACGARVLRRLRDRFDRDPRVPTRAARATSTATAR
ncbi:MAG TPA: hypothetical protein PLS53_04950 [Thermoanaerobaculaceae bacterium]|nr:hypothetical protein [Thermoanaerobaculaceae bacterium]HPS77484.1 hypothetical protein [Thermoanaerobaculaceae bacterium]